MDLEGKLKAAFRVCTENLGIFLPRALELALEIAAFLVFIFLFALFVGLSLSPVAISSLSDLDSLLEGITSQVFLLALFFIFGLLVFVFLTMLLRALARAAVIGMAEEGIASGKAGLDAGWRAAKRHGWDVFWAELAVGIILVLILGAGTVPFLVAALLGLEETFLLAFGFFGIFAGGIAALLVYVLTLFAPQEIVLKGKGAIGGIKGSAAFVGGNVFDVVIYIAVVIGISMAIGMLGLGAFLPISILSERAPLLGVASNIFQNLFSVAISLLLAPYYETVKTAMVREGSASASGA